MRALAALLAMILALANPALAEDRSILVQSTTSTANSGLYDHLLPIFQAESGIQVNVVAVGTGQAIKNARNGDGDVLLVHSREAEEAFVAEGWGVERFDLMYNDFVLVGPEDDPADVAGMTNATNALDKIRRTGSIFASRGDNSGTHAKERALWSDTGSEPQAGEPWYRETGAGMGATLTIATNMGAYTLSDRATWISYGNKGTHRVLVEGDPKLFNQYGVILVNPAKHPRVRSGDGQIFIDWLRSPRGQQAIAAFQVDGQQLFTPNAH
ncbi:MAG: substrate-binding domain-containing protein [Pseudomonadota bacterium]